MINPAVDDILTHVGVSDDPPEVVGATHDTTTAEGADQ